MDTTLVVASFPEESKAYQAYSEFKEADSEGRIGLLGSALIRRDSDGRLQLPEGDDQTAGSRTFGGGLIGMLIGVLGGPVGLLLGWTGGLLVGGIMDVHSEDKGWQMLTSASTAVPLGSTAVFAEVNEPAVEVIDGIVAGLGGSVVRRPADDVLAEIEDAQLAEEAAEKEVRQRKREEKRQASHEKYEERKARLHAEAEERKARRHERAQARAAT